MSVSIQKKALNTSLRSAAHATDSTWSGCQANKAATIALRHRAPVSCLNQRNNSKVLATWKSRLVTWWPPGFKPNNWQSSMCEIHVSGCQLAAYPLWKAQPSPAHVNPLLTCELLMMYASSSRQMKSWCITGQYKAAVTRASVRQMTAESCFRVGVAVNMIESGQPFKDSMGFPIRMAGLIQL